jgi:choline dehydrogenase
VAGERIVRPRAVVVGAGSAGCVLASRLADRYEVVVIEAGRPVAQTGLPTDADADAIAHPPTWSLPALLTANRRWRATPGRAVGGSSVVNGGYFAVPTDADLERWHEAGGEAWQPERVRSLVAEAGARLGVQPSPQTHPIARAFAEAADEVDRVEGLLVLDTTVRDGAARSVAEAYLDPRIELRGDCRALRVVVDDGRATGVEVADSDGTREVIAADEVILCAGGFGTARLLLASGLGPADQLRAVGIEPVRDLPGVGSGFSDHPTVWVEWMPTPALAGGEHPEDGFGAFPLALCVNAEGAPGDDVEILACTQPPDPEARSSREPAAHGLIVGLQRPASCGTVVAASAHPLSAPTISYGYLSDPHDRGALRTGVRLAAELLATPAFTEIVERLIDLDERTLADDDLLDAWIAGRVGSAAHTCGTAPMGSGDDPLAVVDGAGRVRGIAGLRIGDTSLLPRVPSRGPAAAAMAVGAIVADQL